MADVLKNGLYEAFATASDNVYIYVTDMKTGVARWSKGAVEYFGLPDEYLNNAGEVWGEYVHPDDKAAYIADIEAVFSGKANHHSCQYRARNRYGKYVWLECKGTMIYDDEGKQKIFAGMMTRLDNQSLYDPLTGLLSRDAFYNYNFSEGQGVVLLVGIDNFKRIINSYGYNYGNDILIEIAKKLADGCEDGQKALRFNGDEFMLILPDVDRENMIKIYQDVKVAVENLTMPDGKAHVLSVSAGAECYPINGVGKDEMVNRLELAMDYVKRINKGSMAFYSGEVEARQLRRMELKKELHESIANDFEGFELYYQPWIDAKGMRILGCEALLRWKGNKIQDSFPMEFIPELEEDGSIVEVGRYVMKESIRQQKIWQEEYGNFKVSFNVSYQQFLVNGYVEEVVATAKEYGVNPDNIVLELTESSDVEAPENLAVVFEKLREHGFHVALDDFGTGYSSVELLKKLPADAIKIEHNFVRELRRGGRSEDFAIIESLMMLCNRLNRDVVVEGVENEEVDGIIRDMNNATYLQGYYYSRPICKADFDQMLIDYSQDSEKVIEKLGDKMAEAQGFSFERMVINSLSNMFLSLFMFDLKEDSYQEYRGNQAVHAEAGYSGRLTGRLNHIIVKLIDDKTVGAALEFVKMDTLQDRLEGQTKISQDFTSKTFGACRMTFIPVRYDEQGNLENVLLAVQKLG